MATEGTHKDAFKEVHVSQLWPLQVCVSVQEKKRAKQLVSPHRAENTACIAGMSPCVFFRFITHRGSEILCMLTRVLLVRTYLWGDKNQWIHNAKSKMETACDSKGVLDGWKATKLITLSSFKTTRRPWWCCTWSPEFLIYAKAEGEGEGGASFRAQSSGVWVCALQAFGDRLCRMLQVLTWPWHLFGIWRRRNRLFQHSYSCVLQVATLSVCETLSQSHRDEDRFAAFHFLKWIQWES